MSSSTARIQNVTKLLLKRQPKTFTEDMGIEITANDPQSLFCLLTGALLLSARIGHELAMKSARMLFERGWTTPQKMAKSTWEQRVKALDEGGYTRYDERTSTMLGETAQAVIEKYGGDLRRLRDAARTGGGRPDPARERKLLKEFKGIGDVGADIFFREAQLVWPELYPFADSKGLETAEQVGLPAEAQALARLIRRKRDFVRLVDALITVRLNHEQDQIRPRVAAA
jgi:endonuclease III